VTVYRVEFVLTFRSVGARKFCLQRDIGLRSEANALIFGVVVAGAWTDQGDYGERRNLLMLPVVDARVRRVSLFANTNE
jgi:hypothetical protein